jgi:hypothetical protein
MEVTNAPTRPPSPPARPVEEVELATLSGYVALMGAAVLLAAGITLVKIDSGPSAAIGVAVFAVTGLVLFGLTPVTSGQVRVVQLFGRYKGTVRTTGLRWVNPFALRRPVSVRIRNHESVTVKVNDSEGNPIEMAAVVVWQVRDSGLALYAVDDFVAFVNTQSETAIRHVANTNPYDNGGGTGLSLRDNTDEVTGQLAREIAVRVAAEDDEEVGHHGGLAFLVELDDVLLGEPGEGHLHHADGMTPYDAFTSESAYRNRRESLDDPPTGTYSLQALT